MSHIVVGIVIGIAAVLLWLTRRPWRTWAIAIPVGIVGVALTAVWSLPLVANQAYTQSMRYTKLYPKKGFTMWSWLPVPARSATRSTASYARSRIRSIPTRTST